MFDNPSPDSWNPKVSTAPSYGLYLYDIGYDKADLALPIIEQKLEESIVGKSYDECSLDLKKEIIKQRMINRKISLDTRIAKAKEKIKSYEFLKSVEN